MALSLPLCCYSQTSASIDTLPNGNVLVEVNGISAIVLKDAIKWKDGVVSSWSPTVEELVICEKLVMKYVQKHSKECNVHPGDQHPVICENFDNYYWQFYCYFDEYGHKIALVECVWKDKAEALDLKWKEKLIGICGGGSYFWGIKVNMRRKKCFSFCYN